MSRYLDHRLHRLHRPSPSLWADSGEPADNLEWIALHCEWARGLMYCDMEGFAVDQDGALLLMDECGLHRYPPEGIFRVEWTLPAAAAAPGQEPDDAVGGP